MRSHLKGVKTEEEIFNVLRKSQIVKKLKKLPTDLLGKQIGLRSETLELLIDINDVRGDLTHPKTLGHDIYTKLQMVDPTSVVEAVAEYIVKYHEAAQTRYPYWIFGWNYINPRPNSCEICLINDQQFPYSLQAIGFELPTSAHAEAEAWRNRFLGHFEGYVAIRDQMRKLSQCEPKFDRFPFKPILCRRWWTAEHQRVCGHVTEASMNVARGDDA